MMVELWLPACSRRESCCVKGQQHLSTTACLCGCMMNNEKNPLCNPTLPIYVHLLVPTESKPLSHPSFIYFIENHCLLDIFAFAFCSSYPPSSLNAAADSFSCLSCLCPYFYATISPDPNQAFDKLPSPSPHSSLFKSTLLSFSSTSPNFYNFRPFLPILLLGNRQHGPGTDSSTYVHLGSITSCPTGCDQLATGVN